MGASAARTSKILISIHGPLAIAYCIGTLDRSRVGELCDRVLELAAMGVHGIVCSLERTSHIHFQALDPLVRLQQAIEARGARLVLADASPYLRQILDFGGVPRSVSLLEDKHAAVFSLQQATDFELQHSVTG
jgi:anti-anti-sigma regulatory factor